jgi:hypothetical protein
MVEAEVEAATAVLTRRRYVVILPFLYTPI